MDEAQGSAQATNPSHKSKSIDKMKHLPVEHICACVLQKGRAHQSTSFKRCPSETPSVRFTYLCGFPTPRLSTQHHHIMRRDSLHDFLQGIDHREDHRRRALKSQAQGTNFEGMALAVRLKPPRLPAEHLERLQKFHRWTTPMYHWICPFPASFLDVTMPTKIIHYIITCTKTMMKIGVSKATTHAQTHTHTHSHYMRATPHPHPHPHPHIHTCSMPTMGSPSLTASISAGRSRCTTLCGMPDTGATAEPTTGFSSSPSAFRVRDRNNRVMHHSVRHA
eukprot:1157853-Pelagomonas_calceolata.AAC.11